LPQVDEPKVRPVSDQQPQTTASPTTAAPAPKKPQPTKSQLEVMKQLEEMYKRDGREMPPMHMKDAPNTYLPKDKMPKKTASAPASNPAQVKSSPPHAMPNHAPANNYSNLFNEHASSNRKLSLLDRLRGRGPSKPGSSPKSDGGLFGKLLSPFRGDTKPKSLPPHNPPAPPALPEYDSPSNIAEHPLDEPRPFEQTPARQLEPYRLVESPSAAPSQAAPSQAAASQAAAREPNPFAEVADETETIMVIAPAGSHPLEDAFVEVRGEIAPRIETVAAVDPEFINDNSFDVTAPRTLEPEDVAGADENAFAPVAPEIESPQEATAARYAELQRKLAERSGLGGFQGFCPVALRDRRELVDARPEFLSIYQGRTYELASAEAKARFEADPAKYAPMSQGNDVVLTSRGENEAEGNLHYAVWFKDRLYLFRTPETLREFNADPTKFAIVE
jgi:YHS domain-containing protein